MAPVPRGDGLADGLSLPLERHSPKPTQGPSLGLESIGLEHTLLLCVHRLGIPQDLHDLGIPAFPFLQVDPPEFLPSKAMFRVGCQGACWIWWRQSVCWHEGHFMCHGAPRFHPRGS